MYFIDIIYILKNKIKIYIKKKKSLSSQASPFSNEWMFRWLLNSYFFQSFSFSWIFVQKIISKKVSDSFLTFLADISDIYTQVKARLFSFKYYTRHFNIVAMIAEGCQVWQKFSCRSLYIQYICIWGIFKSSWYASFKKTSHHMS